MSVSVFLPNFDAAMDLAEVIDNRSPGRAQYAPGASSEEIQYRVPFDVVNSFVIGMLGYHYVDESGEVPILRRTAPAASPLNPFMFATRIGPLIGERFDRKQEDIIAPAPWVEIPAYAHYENVVATVIFETLPYPVRPKGNSQEVANAWDWYFAPTFEPGEEAISAQLGSLTFVEGPSATLSAPATIGIITSKTMVTYTWYMVPMRWIRDVDNEGPPVQFLRGLGRVNATDFLGYPAGTLLARPPRITQYTSTIGLNGQRPEFLCDITFQWQYFDPENGNPSSTYRGHNLVPSRADGKYYYATLDGTSGGRPIYASYEFRNFFKHWSQ